MADVKTLIEASDMSRQYKQLPRFPTIIRDIAIVVRDELYVAQLMDVIRKSGGEYLEDVELFDVYKGAQVPEGMKSVAYTLTFRSPDRTLVDDEVNRIMEKIINGLKAELDATLR